MKTVLFDLDGTLLPMDMDAFTGAYFAAIARSLADLSDGKELIRWIWASTLYMIANDEERTNEEVFMEKFSEFAGERLPLFRQRFDAFYVNEFPALKDTVVKNDLVVKSVELLKNKGYELVVATNPLFPKSAILSRIEWAGLDPRDFVYISHYEKNHFCKPNLGFYREILRDIGKQGNDCLMVGNDVSEDMIAGKLGMKTYLITDCAIHIDSDVPYDRKGSYGDFYQFTEALPVAE